MLAIVPAVSSAFALPERLTPVPDRGGLDALYWSEAAQHRLVVQRCGTCRRWQWGPEWICVHCRSFVLRWEELPAVAGEYQAVIFSWERVWHPTDRGLADAVPYVAVIVALPAADGIRMLGNLLGDARDEVTIGAPVRAVFEDHDTYTLVQWERC